MLITEEFIKCISYGHGLSKEQQALLGLRDQKKKWKKKLIGKEIAQCTVRKLIALMRPEQKASIDEFFKKRVEKLEKQRLHLLDTQRRRFMREEKRNLSPIKKKKRKKYKGFHEFHAREDQLLSADFLSSKEFLNCFQWRRLRMEAIEKYGAKCQCCGNSPKGEGIKINVDHIKNRKDHPELALSLDNLQVLCNLCNHGKGNWSSTDWR